MTRGCIRRRPGRSGGAQALESQRPGLVFETRAPVTNIAIPLVAGLAKGLHSLEPGLWAALNQKRWSRSAGVLCHPLAGVVACFCAPLWPMGNIFCESFAR